MVASGKIIVRCTSCGDKPVVKDVKVNPRPKNQWKSTVDRRDETGFHSPKNGLTQKKKNQYPKTNPMIYKHLGAHVPDVNHGTARSDNSIRFGPNRGYGYIVRINNDMQFISRPYIHEVLVDSTSDFSKKQNGKCYYTLRNSNTIRSCSCGDAQRDSCDLWHNKKMTIKDKEKFAKKLKIPVYLNMRGTKKQIKNNEWTYKKVAGLLTLVPTNEKKFKKDCKIPPSAKRYVDYDIGHIEPWDPTEKRIKHAILLANARRHEYRGDPFSHRANFVKAVEALDPRQYAENLIRRPDENFDLLNKLINRVSLLDDKTLGETHYLVDKEKTAKEGKIIYDKEKQIPKANIDVNGKWVGDAHFGP